MRGMFLGCAFLVCGLLTQLYSSSSDEHNGEDDENDEEEEEAVCATLFLSYLTHLTWFSV